MARVLWKDEESSRGGEGITMIRVPHSLSQDLRLEFHKPNLVLGFYPFFTR